MDSDTLFFRSENGDRIYAAAVSTEPASESQYADEIIVVLNWWREVERLVPVRLGGD